MNTRSLLTWKDQQENDRIMSARKRKKISKRKIN